MPLLQQTNLHRGTSVLVFTLILLGAVAGMPVVSAAASPSGPATILTIESVPPSVPADGQQYQSIIVSLADSHRKPSIALSPVLVNLFSSQPNVASVNQSVSIATGHDYAIATLTTTNTPGVTQITASSTGFQSSFVNVKTITPSGLASRLKVFAAPEVILSQAGQNQGLVYVELQDDTGLPAKAATDTTVQLSSSDPLIVGLASNAMTIPAGQIFGTVNYLLPSTSLGTATINAFSTGFASGNDAIKVVAPAGPVPCCKIVLQGILNPTTLPADGKGYAALELLLEDSTGGPVRAPAGGLSVQLSSSKDTVVSVDSTVFMPSGAAFVFVDAQTFFLAGAANITAVSQGYSGSSTTVSTVIPAPSRLTVYVSPSSKVLTSLDQPLVVVQLQDAAGNPARAKADTTVLITSSNSTVVTATLALSIPKGDDFVSTFVQTSAVGSTTLTAGSSGLSSSTVFLSVLPLPLTATLSGPSLTNMNQPSAISLTVTLVGDPLSGASLTWSATKGTLSSASSTTDAVGKATALFTPTSTGRANITVVVTDAAIGVSQASVFLTVFPTPIQPPPTLAEQIVAYSYLILIPIAIIVAYIFFRIRKRRAKRRAELEAAFQTVG